MKDIFCWLEGEDLHPNSLHIKAQMTMNTRRSATIRNYCLSSKLEPKPNLKQGLKKTAGGRASLLGSCHGHYPGVSNLPPPFNIKKSTHEPSNAHLQLAHPALPGLSAFEVEFPSNTQTPSQVCSSERSISGERKINEESGEGWRERGGGLKGERLFNSRNPWSPFLFALLLFGREWYFMEQTMAQWKKSPLILLLITQKSLCSKALYTFFPFCANALSWEWLVSLDKSPHFILPLQGCCFTNNRLTVIPSCLAVNPRRFWWRTPTDFCLLPVNNHLSVYSIKSNQYGLRCKTWILFSFVFMFVVVQLHRFYRNNKEKNNDKLQQTNKIHSETQTCKWSVMECAV